MDTLTKSVTTLWNALNITDWWYVTVHEDLRVEYSFNVTKIGSYLKYNGSICDYVTRKRQLCSVIFSVHQFIFDSWIGNYTTTEKFHVCPDRQWFEGPRSPSYLLPPVPRSPWPCNTLALWPLGTIGLYSLVIYYWILNSVQKMRIWSHGTLLL